VIAGIGLRGSTEILWRAMLSPYKRGNELGEEELARLAEAISSTLGGAIEHYEASCGCRSGQTPRCPADPPPRGRAVSALRDRVAGGALRDHVIAYCPTCQTGGRILKDRRLSRLLR